MLGKNKISLKTNLAEKKYFGEKTKLAKNIKLAKQILAKTGKIVNFGFSFMGYDYVNPWIKVLSHVWQYIWFLSQWDKRVLYPRSCNK